MPNDSCFFSGALLARDLRADLGVLFFASRQRDTQTIEDRRLGRLDGIGRDLFIVCGHHELGDLSGYVHQFLHSISEVNSEACEYKLLPYSMGASFPTASIGNPAETVTGPPTKTFGGDNFEIVLIDIS